MCACRQKKSFFIEDILKDVKHKPYKNISTEPREPLKCSASEKKDVNETIQIKLKEKANNEKRDEKIAIAENEIKFNVIREVQNELEYSKLNLEQRRNTYPLYPQAIKPSIAWPYRKELYADRPFTYYSEPMLNSDILRSQLASRFPTPYLRQPYGYDRVSPGWCSPWWGLGRRKGGQVRFSAAQTSALERRFTSSKYLSPDERRALATSLRLSDRQVKTWFQNRRAKWRRLVPESADPGSPASDDSDDDALHT